MVLNRSAQSQKQQYKVDCIPRLVNFFNFIVLPEQFFHKNKNATECKKLLKDIAEQVAQVIDNETD